MYEFIYTKLKEICINEKYLNRYMKFIETYNGSGNIKHHALPQAPDMFPEYKSFKIYSWNCIHFSERAHFVAHWMLWKAVGKSQALAFYQMRHKNKKRLNSKSYALLLEDFKKAARNPERRKKLSVSIKAAHKEKRCGMYNKPQSSHQKELLSKLKCGVPMPKEAIEKRLNTMKTKIQNGWVQPTKGKTYEEYYGADLAEIKRNKIKENHHNVVGKNNPMYGKEHSFDTKEKIRKAALSKDKVKCEYCGTLSNIGNYKRWHGENCKLNPK